MSGPPRRRSPVITRGKKSDKKKKKLAAQNKVRTSPQDGFAELRQGLDSQRKEILRGNSQTNDRGVLSEPSPLFFDKTESIRSKKKEGQGAAILLEEPRYKNGINISKVKQERMLVIDGKRSSVFQDLSKQYKELTENLKQEVKESQTEVLERGRKREEQNKKKAAEESEKRRLEKEKIEADKRKELLRLEEVAKLQAAELEKSRAIEQERLDLLQKEKIEADKRKELLRLEEVAKLQGMEKKKLEDRRSEISPKRGLLQRLWEKIKDILLSMKPQPKHHLQKEALVVEEPAQELVEVDEPEEEVVIEKVEIVTPGEEIDIQEEVFVVEEPVQEIVEVEVHEEVLVDEEPAQELVEVDEPEEEVLVDEPVQEIVEVEVHEEEVLVDEEPMQEFVEVDEPEEEVVIEEVEIETPSEEIDIQEEVFVVEEPVQEIVEVEVREEVVEELPDFETGEVLLADLRITMRDEVLPIEFILKVLMEKHSLSKKDVNILIDHVASPFSICKTMKGDGFERFIESFDDQNSQSKGVEIWTQIIQIIGLNSLSADQQVEIYNLFMGDEKKVNQKVRTIAILYHFLPMKFERWWQKEMIDSFTMKKYDSDYRFYQKKNFSEQIIEEARMLICAYAIEKPRLVAKEYTSAKHQAGKHHENQTELWLKKVAGKIEYLTEGEIQKFAGQKYGNKHVSKKITPDILLKKPIQLSKEGQHIHWIDAKKHFIDPALSPEFRVGSFCNQLEKYVRAYGPGLIVWGKDFSEEWNDATKGVVQHIKI